MLKSTFNPEKFLEQCKAHAIRCGYPQEAEDFAQFAFLQVWKYQHYQPMIWTWSTYLRNQFGNIHSESGRLKSQARRFDGNGDQLLEDDEGNFLDRFIPSPEQAVEQKERLTLCQEFVELLKKATSINSLVKLKRTAALRTEEFRDYIEGLEPLRLDRLDL